MSYDDICCIKINQPINQPGKGIARYEWVAVLKSIVRRKTGDI